MTKREQFITIISVGALAYDTQHKTNNARQVLEAALAVPEESIPDCPVNAAKAFLAYCNGFSDRPFKWMF